MKNELINVNIENREGKVVVSSRVVAKELSKEHNKVMRDIRNILNNSHSPDLDSEIMLSKYTNSRGREYDEYLLTKDGFTLYMFNIQGYNDFKMAYINRFNEMEKQLQEQNRPSYTIQDPIERAKQWIKEQEEKRLLETKLEEQQPKVQIADERLLKNGCYSITEINEAGRAYFKIYDNGGYRAIGITEEGLKLVQENIEEFK